RVDGVIVAGSRTDPRPPIDVGQTGVPVIYAFARTPDPRALCLVPDNEQGGRLAVGHLLENGRRRVAHVTGPEGFEAVRQRAGRGRRAGMVAALVAAGLDPGAAPVLQGPWREDWGRAAAERLIAEHPEVDAIFCGSDVLARGVADALRERGVHVPDDIALVGF